MTITAERPVTEPSVEDLAGVFNDVNSAVGAARRAFVAFSECSLAQRRAFVDAVREAATQQDRLEYMASAAVQDGQRPSQGAQEPLRCDSHSWCGGPRHGGPSG